MISATREAAWAWALDVYRDAPQGFRDNYDTEDLLRWQEAALARGWFADFDPEPLAGEP